MTVNFLNFLNFVNFLNFLNFLNFVNCSNYLALHQSVEVLGEDAAFVGGGEEQRVAERELQATDVADLYLLVVLQFLAQFADVVSHQRHRLGVVGVVGGHIRLRQQSVVLFESCVEAHRAVGREDLATVFREECLLISGHKTA